MGEVSGIDLFKKVINEKVETPVVFMSGDASLSDAVKAVRMGAFDFLEKPFDSEVLENRLSRAIEKRKKILVELNGIEKRVVEQGLIEKVNDFYQLSSAEREDLARRVSRD